MLAAFGVIFSLGLVAYELKQSRDTAAAELSMSLISERREIFLAALEPDALNSALDKLKTGKEWTDVERRNYYRYQDSFIGLYHQAFILWSTGLLASGEWEGTKKEIIRNFETIPRWREDYTSTKIDIGSDAFKLEMGALLAEAEARIKSKAD
ncbi:MAG: hypothetical protein ABJ084_10240 [Halioglobus sp.]